MPRSAGSVRYPPPSTGSLTGSAWTVISWSLVVGHGHCGVALCCGVLAGRAVSSAQIGGLYLYWKREEKGRPGSIVGDRSWSLSPTSTNLVVGSVERSSQAMSGRSTIDTSSTITAPAGRNSSSAGSPFSWGTAALALKRIQLAMDGVHLATGRLGQPLGVLPLGESSPQGTPRVRAGRPAPAWSLSCRYRTRR